MGKLITLITLYCPPVDIIEKAVLLAKQVDLVYLIDNTSSNSETLSFNNIKIKYVKNEKNLGLSQAFNKILQNEQFNDDDYIIFFDQDFKISNNYIRLLVNSFELNLKNNIGILGPLIYDRNTNAKSISRYAEDNKLSIVPRVITSSSITTYKILKEINYWDNCLFLDWADFDICYRIRAKGYHCAIDSSIVLNHQLGDKSKRFMKRTYPYYSPIREYYQIRDALNLRKKKTTPLKDSISMLYVCSFRFIIHLIIFDRKKERIHMWKKALHDYFHGIYGEIEYE